MSATLLAAAAENREASPIGLVVILLLVVALVFLIRSMNKHLRKVPRSFSRSESERTPPPREPEDQ
jgi:uncharacterized protein HemY